MAKSCNLIYAKCTQTVNVQQYTQLLAQQRNHNVYAHNLQCAQSVARQRWTQTVGE